jgi:hypothetical protein
MGLATDSAWTSPARWFLVFFGMTACVANVGCAKLRSYTQGESPPMVGAAAPFGTKEPAGVPRGDLYASQVGKGISQSRTLLAQERAKAERERASTPKEDDTTLVRSTEHPTAPPDQVPPADPNSPLQVALQPPVNLPPRNPDLPPVLGEADKPAATTAPLAPAPAQPGGLASQDKNTTDLSAIKSVLADSRSRLETMASYQVTIKRQERVANNLLPAEEVLLSIRRKPKAVRLEWPDGANKGREVLYSANSKDGKMHVKMPSNTLVPVPPLALAPDSPMVMRSSRHPITEAGFDTIIEDLEKNVAQSAAGGTVAGGKLTYGGLENPGQLERPAHKLVRVTPTGETWVVFIDPKSNLPVLVQGTAANGDLLERYLFGEPTTNPSELLSADAFDPERRWGKPAGLFSRLARAGGAKPAADTSTR